MDLTSTSTTPPRSSDSVEIAAATRQKLTRVATNSEADPGPLRIVAVATAQERLGTSHYARKLAASLNATLLSTEMPALQLLSAIRSVRPSVCHLQFEYRAFGGSFRTLLSLPRFASRAAKLCPLVVTLHGVLAKDTGKGLVGRASFWAYRRMIRRTAREAARVVVLSDRMRSELSETYQVRNVTVIPMGCDPPSPPMPRRGRPYILFFGYLRPSKGILELLQAFQRVGQEFPDLELVIAGALAKQGESSFVTELQDAFARHPLRDRIIIRNEFIDMEEKGRLAQGAALIVLPYKDRFIEISGVVHDVAASGTPILCSDIPRFDELEEGVEAIHVASSPESIALGISRILSDQGLRSRLSRGIAELARRESWAEIGKQHQELYSEILSESRPPGANVR